MTIARNTSDTVIELRDFNTPADQVAADANVADPVALSLPGTAKLRLNGSDLELSADGADWGAVATNAATNPVGKYTATEVGILTTNTASQNSDAWDAWYATLPYTGGAILEFDTTPLGSYYDFARTLEIQKTMILRCGGAPGGRSVYAAYLRWPVNTTGIRIKSANLTPPYGRGDATRIEDLTLVGLGYGGATSGDGIEMLGRGELRNLWITNFGGNGISIVASSGDGNNANNWRIQNCASVENKGHGLYVDGADSNAGIALSLDCSSNLGYGIYDSSFLGNTYVGCHTDANITGSYKADDSNARCLFLGCYVEGGQPLPALAPSNSLWIGGLSEGGLASGNGIIDQLWNGLLVNAKGNGNSGIWNYIHIGSTVGEGEQAYFRLWNEEWAGSSLTLRYAPSDNFFEWYAADYGSPQQRIAAPQGAIIGTRFVPAATLVLPNEFYLGTNKHISLAASPTTGTWKIGDRVYNSAPVSGGTEGWVCTAAGTQGTYAHTRTATANGTTTVTLSGAEAAFKVGDYLTINGITGYVVSNSGTTLVMSSAVTAGSGLAIDYANATFKAFGSIA